MTKLLETALRKLAELPEAEQDAVARLILDELEDESRWERTFAESPERLAHLADAAREEVRRGDVVPGDPATRDG